MVKNEKERVFSQFNEQRHYKDRHKQDKELAQSKLETKEMNKRWKDYWLEKGTKIEMEHIPSIRKMYPEFRPARYVHTDKEIAEAIAYDHLQESPLYYKYLTKMEKKLKKMKK